MIMKGTVVKKLKLPTKRALMIDNDLTNSEVVSYLLLVLVLCCSALLTGMNGYQCTRDL
jgi:hypothetical protein